MTEFITDADEAATLLPRTFAEFERGRARGLHLGMQLALWHEPSGRQIDAAWGDNRPGEPLTGRHWLAWRSGGKPVTALLVLRRIERGMLALNQGAAEVWPEFGRNGKGRITIRHLLTHNSGMEPVATGWPEVDWEESCRRVAAAGLRPGAEPGNFAAYDPQGTWFALGEVVRRSDAGDEGLAESAEREIFGPLGMKSSRMALAPRDLEQFAQLGGVMYELQGRDLVESETYGLRGAQVPSPGSSCRGPASDLLRLYRMLLGDGALGEARILSEPTARRMRERHRVGVEDATFAHRLDFGLGVAINSNRYGAETVPYGFGAHCSENTFGHGGAQCATGFADPERRLAVAWIVNGFAGEAQHHRRNRSMNTAIYEDLGLAGG